MNAKPIRIVVSDTANHDVTAPAAKGLCEHILAFITLAEDVESRGQWKDRISWRITNTQMRSPLTIEITPYSSSGGSIDRQASRIIANIVLNADQEKLMSAKSGSIDECTVAAVRHMHRRSNYGTLLFELDFSEYGISDKLCVSRDSAKRYLSATGKMLASAMKPPPETHIIDGYVQQISQDAENRAIVWLRTGLNDERIKCIASCDGLNGLGDRMIKDIFKSLRVQVEGKFHFKDAESIDHVEVSDFYIIPPDECLPSEDDVRDPGLTGGLESCEYIELIRGMDK